MTLPASGAITSAQIRTELGGAGPVVIPSAETRTLTGVSSGPIVGPTNFHGKSSVSPVTGSASPSSISATGTGAITSGSTTVTASGGTGPYTYAWSRISGATIAITSPSSASTTFSATPGAGMDVFATMQCLITDSLGAVGYVYVNVSIRDTTPI